MKRSEINEHLIKAVRFFKAMRFNLPPWAFWRPGQWKGAKPECRDIIDHMLGWDITDFGSSCFSKRGLLLFTLRNGKPGRGEKPYAEKIMIADELQETPMHFHWNKMEDIINRGGGNLILEIFGSTPEETFSRKPIHVSIDGIEKKVAPGGRVRLKPGESICLRPAVYHRFYGEPGKGRVLVGEVSMVNNDSTDNRFYETIGRFPAIEEDEAPLYYLAADYSRFLRKR